MSRLVFLVPQALGFVMLVVTVVGVLGGGGLNALALGILGALLLILGVMLERYQSSAR